MKKNGVEYCPSYGANADMKDIRAVKKFEFVTDRIKLRAAEERRADSLLDRLEKRRQLAEMRRSK